MDVLNKLALKNLKLNKRRSIGTIIGIILSVALICAVAGLGTSLKETLVQNAINETGYYHIKVMDISKDKIAIMKNNRDVLDIIETYHIGTSNYQYERDKDNNYFDVYSIKQEDMEKLSYKLIDGTYPKNSNEIVVTKKMLLNDNKKIGDTINLNIGHKSIFDGSGVQNPKSKTYKIVGTVSKKTNAEEYYGITTNEESEYLYGYVILKNPKEYKETVPKILGLKNWSEVDLRDIEVTGFDHNVNRELLRWEAFAFSDSNVTMLYMLIGIVISIIIFTSVFCIRNSFAISTSEKRKMYGMLSSVGATKKQIKQAVLKEGFILGIIGIPIGILFGIIAVYVLTSICNLIMGEFLFETGIVAKISIMPIILTIILGILTIYFSALGTAKKTSEISPIESLKGNEEIKITGNKLKVPKIISKCFKTGGVIAYKNLKRSKRKYRTTVVSLTISIFAFISMFSFINESMKNTNHYWQDSKYNISINRVTALNDSEIEKLNSIVDIKNKYIVYEVRSSAVIESPKFNNSYEANKIRIEEEIIENENEPAYISILALDNETFKAYAKQIGKSYDELKDKAILFDEYYSSETGESTILRAFEYKEGDKIKVTLDSKQIDMTIGGVNKERPYGLEKIYYTNGFIVVNKDYYDLKFEPSGIYIDSSNAENTIEDITKTYEGKDIRISNMEDKVKEDKAMLLLASIFLYGFITVITLIGVTNIFNTITSNIELRANEFAMLKRIGMTKKEFKRMINLETIFYCTKSLFYGIILGIIGSIFVHKAYSINFESNFLIPYKAIIISVIAVFILVSIIMRYGMNKINKQNIIETIRNDNV